MGNSKEISAALGTGTAARADVAEADPLLRSDGKEDEQLVADDSAAATKATTANEEKEASQGKGAGLSEVRQTEEHSKGKQDPTADIQSLPEEDTCTANPEGQPGAYAIRNPRGDRRSLPPASRPTTATSTATQEALLRQAQEPQDDSAQPTTGSAVGEVPLLNALLVSDPPLGFDNCQICMTACDGGKGWEACRDRCVPDATFSCHNDTLGSMATLQEYADFIAFFGRACPNATWTTHDVFWDGTTHTAFFHCTYHVTHTVSVPGLGPETPTLRSSDANYCYIIRTDPNRQGKITHVQKLWNDAWLLRDLGWIPDEKGGGENNETTPQQEAAASTPSSQGDASMCHLENNHKAQQPPTRRNAKRRVWGRLRRALGLSSSTRKGSNRSKRSERTIDSSQFALAS